jgi:hypothetical protein
VLPVYIHDARRRGTLFHRLINRGKQNRLFREVENDAPARQARDNLIVLGPALRHRRRCAKSSTEKHHSRERHPTPAAPHEIPEVPIAHNQGTVAQSRALVMRFASAPYSGKIES